MAKFRRPYTKIKFDPHNYNPPQIIRYGASESEGAVQAVSSIHTVIRSLQKPRPRPKPKPKPKPMEEVDRAIQWTMVDADKNKLMPTTSDSDHFRWSLSLSLSVSRDFVSFRFRLSNNSQQYKIRSPSSP